MQDTATCQVHVINLPKERFQEKNERDWSLSSDSTGFDWALPFVDFCWHECREILRSPAVRGWNAHAKVLHALAQMRRFECIISCLVEPANNRSRGALGENQSCPRTAVQIDTLLLCRRDVWQLGYALNAKCGDCLDRSSFDLR